MLQALWEKCKNAAVWVAGALLMLTYLFALKEKNASLFEENKSLKNEKELDKSEAAEKAAGKVADDEEAKFNTMRDAYESTKGKSSGPAGNA